MGKCKNQKRTQQQPEKSGGESGDSPVSGDQVEGRAAITTRKRRKMADDDLAVPSSSRVGQADGEGPSTSGVEGFPPPCLTPVREPVREPVQDPDPLANYSEVVGSRRRGWGIPCVRDDGVAKRWTEKAMESLSYLEDLRVYPGTYRKGKNGAEYEGRPLRALNPDARKSLDTIGDALEELQDMAESGGVDSRLADLEEQVGGIKTQLARVCRLLEGLVPLVAAPGQLPAAPPPRSIRGTVRSLTKSGAFTAVKGKPEAVKADAGWTRVTRRQKKKAGGQAVEKGSKPPVRPSAPKARQEGGGSAGKVNPPPKKKAGGTKVPRRRTVPRNPVVSVTGIGERSFADVMREAREKVDMDDIGLSQGLIYKRARNGGALLEIAGPGASEKADRLARELEEALCGEAKIARPVKTAELRVTGLDDATSPDSVKKVLCAIGGCPPPDMLLGELRKGAGGLGTIWVRCPLAAALKLVAAKGRIKIGWAQIRVHLLEERPLQCYRCLRFGHLAATCSDPKDRKGRCFRCGGADHIAKGCTALPRCLLCDEVGVDPGHRLGGRACRAVPGRITQRRPVRKQAAPGTGRRGVQDGESERPHPPPRAKAGEGGGTKPVPPARVRREGKTEGVRSPSCDPGGCSRAEGDAVPATRAGVPLFTPGDEPRSASPSPTPMEVDKGGAGGEETDVRSVGRSPARSEWEDWEDEGGVYSPGSPNPHT